MKSRKKFLPTYTTFSRARSHILDAKNKSQFLAGKLKLPKPIFDEIYKKQHYNAQERLYEVTHEFVNRLEPRPTWRLIIQALRSPLIDLPLLAKKMERKHCPTPKTPNDIIMLLHPPVL